ncbi:MAG: hypothetical protein KJZ78_16940 [Bryobacteraceae bacterium]|nr:hypothetical protein [Bryobacteraceae bacterium]
MRVFYSVVVLWIVLSGNGWTQQREPAFEVYALTGAHYHGNLSLAREWKPQYGAGVLAPLGRNWAAVFDVTTSATEAWWKHDGFPGTGPDDNFTRERRIIMVPSVVRLWRRDRFSIYAGGGVAFEHRRQRTRQRPIVARGPNGEPILGPDFEELNPRSTNRAAALRIGGIVSLTRKVVLRTGYSLLPRYADEKASQSLEFGIGYRF